MHMQVDLIIEPRWLLPIVPRNQILEFQAVVIQAGEIIDIGPIEAISQKYNATEKISLHEHVLMPGLINLHTHAAMNLMRGLADDIALMPWLENHIWPAEKKWVSREFVHDGTLLACAEMLSGGITTFNDMYFFPEAAAAAIIKMGMRANLGLVVLEFPTNYANDAEDYLGKGMQVRDDFRDQHLLSFSLAPHAPYTVSDQSFNSIATLAEQVNIGVHTHVHETHAEILLNEQAHGMRPIERLMNLGILSPNLTLAHCVHLNEIEIELLVKYGCSIAHCPTSNLKLGSGIAPISQYIQYGINIGLGTDGAASNNRLDMFAEMRLAALLAKGSSGDATAVTAHQALEMATINGAKALNLESKVGSIEIGKLADLIAVDLSALELQPYFDVASHLVYVAGREHVTHTWVNGQLQYRRLASVTDVFNDIESSELSEIATKWQLKLGEFK